MIAYKSTKKVTDKKIFINLPDKFNNKGVEILVFLKYPEETHSNINEVERKHNLISLLEKTPQWDDTQERAFADAREYYQLWERK